MTAARIRYERDPELSSGTYKLDGAPEGAFAQAWYDPRSRNWIVQTARGSLDASAYVYTKAEALALLGTKADA
jgi:hypothetical protein